MRSGQDSPHTLRLDQIPDPGGFPIKINSQSVLIVRRGDVVRAYHNTCPHQNRPLCLPDGKVLISEGRFIVCPFHGASFDISSGANVGGPGTCAGLIPVEVTLEGGFITIS